MKEIIMNTVPDGRRFRLGKTDFIRCTNTIPDENIMCYVGDSRFVVLIPHDSLVELYEESDLSTFEKEQPFYMKGMTMGSVPDGGRFKFGDADFVKIANNEEQEFTTCYVGDTDIIITIMNAGWVELYEKVDCHNLKISE